MALSFCDAPVLVLALVLSLELEPSRLATYVEALGKSLAVTYHAYRKNVEVALHLEEILVGYVEDFEIFHVCRKC